MGTSRGSVAGMVSQITNALTLDWEPEDPADPSPNVEARFPTTSLPLLLHELTHHQCFLSAVGDSLNNLWRIAIAATRDPRVEAAAERGEVPDDFLRLMQNFAAGVLVYEPWMEGVAVFAEWDAVPGRSQAASKAMTRCHFLYLLSQSDFSPETAWDRFARELVAARRTPGARALKTNLLSVDLREESGHYLSGYLGVRALYRKALSRSALFLDTDFFCSFLTLALFNDPVAAGILMDVDTPFDDWLERLRRRLDNRLDLFDTPNLDRRARRHEASSVTAEQVLGPLSEAADSASLHQYAEMIATHHDEISATHEGHNTSVDLAAGDWDRLEAAHFGLLLRFKPVYSHATALDALTVERASKKQRVFIRLRKVHGRAVAGARDVELCNAEGRVVARVDKNDGVPDGFACDGATYVLFCYPEQFTFFRVLYVMSEQGVVLLGGTYYRQGEEPDASRNALYFNAIMNNERAEFCRDLPGGERDTLELAGASLDAREAAAARRVGQRSALGVVLREVDDARYDDLVGRLSPLGVFGWVGRSPRIVEASTLVSLHASDLMSGPEIRERLLAEGADWGGLAEAIDRIRVVEGVELWSDVCVDGRAILCPAF